MSCRGPQVPSSSLRALNDASDDRPENGKRKNLAKMQLANALRAKRKSLSTKIDADSEEPRISDSAVIDGQKSTVSTESCDVIIIDGGPKRTKVMEDDTNDKGERLRRKAAEVLIREAKNAAERAAKVGPQGWVKPRSLNTNKRFLARTLQSAELSRREMDDDRRYTEEKKRLTTRRREEVAENRGKK